MSKSAAIIVGIIIAIAGGVGYLIITKDDADAPVSVSESTTTGESATTTTTTPTTTSTAGSYLPYSAQAVASASGEKILFFHAQWCPQCKSLERDIKQTTLPENVTVFEVDYDTNQDLKQKYGVTLQTTLVKVDDAGNLISRFVAYDDPTWDAVAANLL